MIPSPRPGPAPKTTPTTTRPRSPETHLSLKRRTQAVHILQSYEKLSWFALQRNESLPQTRQYFLSVVAGLDDPSSSNDHLQPPSMVLKTDTSPHNGQLLPESIHSREPPLGGEGRRKSSAVPASKGKERASLGGANEGRASPGGSGSGSGRKKRKSAQHGV